MKKILTLGTILLGCCLAAAGQTGGSTTQDQPGTAPSAYPQGQSPAVQENPAAPSAVAPDASAPGQAAQEQAADPAQQSAISQLTTVQGCLSKSAGDFILAEDSGQNYQLAGDTSQLAGLIGKEVQVSGMAMSNGGQDPSSMSSDNADSSSGPASSFAQISVSKVRKIANVCSAPAATVR
jgi:hypothetical protein